MTVAAFDRFIQSARALFAREKDPALRWEGLAPHMSELLADPEVVEASKRWPECAHKERAENLLFYEDPDFVRGVFEFAVELGLRFAKAQLDAGVDIVGVGDAAA